TSEDLVMNIDDSPLARLLNSVLSVEEKALGSYEDPTKSPAGGNWSEPGVPHTGWHVVDYYKLDDRDHLCEMCERQMVRFVHVMRHDNYHDDLKVGCVCAGHMECDLEGARKREVRYRNKSKRRDNWLTRRWKSTIKPAANTCGPTATRSAFIRRRTTGARPSRTVRVATGGIRSDATRFNNAVRLNVSVIATHLADNAATWRHLNEEYCKIVRF
ncbi:MAG: hypothetical protein AAAB20_22025, partial [Rhizobium sp.]